MTVAIPAVSTLKNRFGENAMLVLDEAARFPHCTKPSCYFVPASL